MEYLLAIDGLLLAALILTPRDEEARGVILTFACDRLGSLVLAVTLGDNLGVVGRETCAMVSRTSRSLDRCARDEGLRSISFSILERLAVLEPELLSPRSRWCVQIDTFDFGVDGLDARRISSGVKGR